MNFLQKLFPLSKMWPGCAQWCIPKKSEVTHSKKTPKKKWGDADFVSLFDNFLQKYLMTFFLFCSSPILPANLHKKQILSANLHKKITEFSANLHQKIPSWPFLLIHDFSQGDASPLSKKSEGTSSPHVSAPIRHWLRLRSLLVILKLLLTILNCILLFDISIIPFYF